MNRFFLNLSRFMAVIGGVILTALILLTCVSVTGRLINTILHGAFMQGFAPGLSETVLGWGVGPILGDFELVEAGTAIAIFAFLPLCQITGGHASVDIFTSRLSSRVNRVIVMLGEVIFAIVLCVIAWKLYDGMLGKMRYNETSFLLQFPIWWAYGASLVAASVAAVVGVYVAILRVWEVISGRTILAVIGEAGH